MLLNISNKYSNGRNIAFYNKYVWNLYKCLNIKDPKYLECDL